MGKLRLDKNPTNFAEPESISFALSNVVDDVSFVPDPLLQWRLKSYDDTSTRRHGSPNGYSLPINRPLLKSTTTTAMATCNNKSTKATRHLRLTTSGPFKSLTAMLQYPIQPHEARWPDLVSLDATRPNSTGSVKHARSGTPSTSTRNSTLDAYNFELGDVGDPEVVQRYLDDTLDNIDDCLASCVAFSIGAKLPASGSGPSGQAFNRSAPYPSYHPLAPGREPRKSNDGIALAIVVNDNLNSAAEVQAMSSLLAAQGVTLTFVASHIGSVQTGVSPNASFITTRDILFDAVFIGPLAEPMANGADQAAAVDSAGYVGSRIASNATVTGALHPTAYNSLMEAYRHGKAIGVVESEGETILRALGGISGEPGMYFGDAASVTRNLLDALGGPVRFPERCPTDDVEAICGRCRDSTRFMQC